MAFMVLLFQATAHGFAGAMINVVSGGDILSGFAAGAVSSLIGSGMNWLGSAKNAAGVRELTNFGKSAGFKALTIAAGGLTGGVSSVIAGGNFWSGMRQGLITTIINHIDHWGREATGMYDNPPGDDGETSSDTGDTEEPQTAKEIIELQEVCARPGACNDTSLLDRANNVASGVGIGNDLKLGLIEIGTSGTEISKGLARYKMFYKVVGVAGNVVGVGSSAIKYGLNPTLGNATRLGVQGIAIGSAFVPVVGWGVSIGIGAADMIWGDQFYHWIDN
jgi:hypothetical protein